MDAALTRGFRVTGRVQGVGFRWWASRQADELGVRGTVRNLKNGAVELCVAGSAAALEELESRLERGPAMARVERVEAIPVPSGWSAPPDFRIDS